MVDLAFGGQLLVWVKTIGFWLGFGVLMLFSSISFFYIRKRRRLRFTVLEVVPLGAGKVGFLQTKAGWFKSKWFLGLIDYSGEQVLMTKDKREIQKASSSNMQDIYGEKGFVVLRHPKDNQILVPIDSFQIENYELIADIATADFRDASSRILSRARNETMNSFERYAPIIVGGVMVMVLLITILFILQYVKHSQTEAWSKIMEAGKVAVANNKNTVPSQDAPILIPFPALFFYVSEKLRSVFKHG